MLFHIIAKRFSVRYKDALDAKAVQLPLPPVLTIAEAKIAAALILGAIWSLLYSMYYKEIQDATIPLVAEKFSVTVEIAGISREIIKPHEANHIPTTEAMFPQVLNDFREDAERKLFNLIVEAVWEAARL